MFQQNCTVSYTLQKSPNKVTTSHHQIKKKENIIVFTSIKTNDI